MARGSTRRSSRCTSWASPSRPSRRGPAGAAPGPAAGPTPRCPMNAKRVLVLGGGFAGLWSAVGAARKLDELGQGPDAVEVTLVNRDAFHGIRVRNYEADLTSVL